jgi:hypothetical protein
MNRVQASAFEETAFFEAIARSAVRVLLIGRRAMAALGVPVGTAGYEFWLHADDVEAINEVVAPFDLVPNRTAEAARSMGRYVLENVERVEVLVARQVSTVDGTPVRFDELYARAHRFEVAAGARLAVPTVSDLISTKRFAVRAKDLEDLRLLEALRRELGE